MAEQEGKWEDKLLERGGASGRKVERAKGMGTEGEGGMELGMIKGRKRRNEQACVMWRSNQQEVKDA